MRIRKKIGFVGGCAITQHNVPKEKRFFEVFRTKLKSNHLEEPSFTFSSYNHFYQLESSFERIINKQKIDILILHIRPQPFLLLSKLFIKQLKKNEISLFINPLLFKNKECEKLENSPPPVFNQLALKPRFMSINIVLGKILGIHVKASKQIFNSILKIHSKCNQLDIHLAILGVPPQPLSKQGNSSCQRLNQYLKQKCLDEGIQYFDSYAKMNNKDCFLVDKLHLSIKGHNYLGDILFEGTKNFLR